MTFIEGLHSAGQRAYAMAGITPADIDCAQLYDGFTWFVLGALEALGFCGRERAAPSSRMVASSSVASSR